MEPWREVTPAKREAVINSFAADGYCYDCLWYDILSNHDVCLGCESEGRTYSTRKLCYYLQWKNIYPEHSFCVKHDFWCVECMKIGPWIRHAHCSNRRLDYLRGRQESSRRVLFPRPFSFKKK